LHVQLGDVPAWIGSIATSVALLLTYSLLRTTRREQAALRAEQRQSQARKVSAWCERVEPAPGTGPDKVTIRLQNISDEPIYSVRVAVGAQWAKRSKYEELDVGYVLAPQSDERHTVEIRLDRTSGAPDPSPPVEIIFSDASGGNFWYRDRYGGLTEITTGLPAAGVAAVFFQDPANTA
jgi:hypothetical protein